MITLIDGHNLIAKMPDIRLDEADDEEKLVAKLRRYRAHSNRRVMVFFDAGISYQVAKNRSQGGLTIRFAPQGTTADEMIIKHLYGAKNSRQITVVTSDRDIQRVAKDVGANVMSSVEFARTLTSITDYVPPLSVTDFDETPTISAAEVDEWLAIFNSTEDDP